MKLEQIIAELEHQIQDPQKGLPEEVFLLVSRLVPMVNVDLLVKDENDRTLLAWRDDPYAGPGWHLPGGILRFKEKIETRIRKVAATEIGKAVSFEPIPLAINQVLCDHDTRGHFISLLYKCLLTGEFIPSNGGLTEKEAGFLKWHDRRPRNLIKTHAMYRRFI